MEIERRGEVEPPKRRGVRWLSTYFGSFFGALNGAWRSLMCNEIGFLLLSYPLLNLH